MTDEVLSAFEAEGLLVAQWVSPVARPKGRVRVRSLPVLRSALQLPMGARLAGLFQRTTAEVAAGQSEQLHLDAVQNPQTLTEDAILRIHAGQFAPYLLCSLHLAGALAALDDTGQGRITQAGTPHPQPANPGP